jgi:hypothetical protein
MNAWSRAFPSAKPDAPGQPQLLDQAVLQGLVHRGAERPGQGGDRQAGHGNRSSRRPAVDPLSGCRTGYRTFDTLRPVSQAAIVENKPLGAALAFIREEQLRREPLHGSTKAPHRRDHRDARLFKVG